MITLSGFRNASMSSIYHSSNIDSLITCKNLKHIQMFLSSKSEPPKSFTLLKTKCLNIFTNLKFLNIFSNLNHFFGVLKCFQIIKEKDIWILSRFSSGHTHTTLSTTPTYWCWFNGWKAFFSSFYQNCINIVSKLFINALQDTR